MRKIVLIFIVLFISLIIAVGCSSEKEIMATGIVQGKEIEITSKISAQVNDVLAEEGKQVAKNEKIVLLDDTEYKILLEQTEAGLELAQAQLAEVLNGSRIEELNKAQASLEQLEANIAVLKAQLENLNNKIKKHQELLKIGAIPEQNLDDLLTEKQVLENQILAVEKQKEAAYWQKVILEKGQRSEVIDRLKAQVKNNEAKVELARYKLTHTVIASPINGVINSINIDEGENVNGGSSIASIIDPHELWVKVYLPEDVIGKINLSERVIIKIDSFPKRNFSGEVLDIADKAQFTPRNVQTKDQRTTTVFPVKIKILDGYDVLKIGLPADVYFNHQEKGEK